MGIYDYLAVCVYASETHCLVYLVFHKTVQKALGVSVVENRGGT